MKYNIEKIYRDRGAGALKLKGWAISEGLGDVRIQARAEQPHENHVYRFGRPDLAPFGPKTDHAGFLMQVDLDKIAGPIDLVFSDDAGEQVLTLDLDAPWILDSEIGNPTGILKKKAREALAYYRQVGPKRFVKEKLILGGKPATQADDYETWMALFDQKENPGRVHRHIEAFKNPASFLVISQIFSEADAKGIEGLLKSLEAQYDDNWRLAVINEAKEDVALPDSDRVTLFPDVKDAAADTRADWLVFAGAQDRLAPSALYRFAKAIDKNPELGMLYADEDELDDNGKRVRPYFKSEYAPDSLLTDNYIGNLFAVKKSLYEEEGGLNRKYGKAAQYDLALRSVEGLDRSQIGHIDDILNHKGEILTADTEIRRAPVLAAMKRRGTPGALVDTPYGFNVLYDVKKIDGRNPKVSVIIPTRDNPGVLSNCIHSIFEKTDYPDFEVVIADNGSVRPETLKLFDELKARYDRLKVVRIDIPFNFSRINNLAVAQSDGEFLVFLNDDTEVVAPEWMRSMIGFAQMPHVGAVGAKLLYPDGRVQHSGVILGIGGVAGHIHLFFDPRSDGYHGKLAHTTNYSCVTAACLMIERTKFDAVGQFDENIPVAFNDVDLCCALTDAGYYNLYDPMAVLIHHESVSRGYDVISVYKTRRFEGETRKAQAKWKDLLRHDPMYNENLALNRQDFGIRLP